MRKRFLAMLLALAMMFTLTIPSLPVMAADPTVIDVTDWSELVTALQYATDNPAEPVDIHIIGPGSVDMPSTNIPMIVPANVYLFVDVGGTFLFNGSPRQINNYGAIFIDGTINHSNNIENHGEGKAFKGTTAHIEGNEKFISNGDPIDRDLNWVVTFDANGGDFGYDDENNLLIRITTSVLKSNPLLPYQTPPTRPGFSFAGWFDANDNEWEPGDTINGDMILYAKWGDAIYDIDYILNGGINDAGNPITYTENDPDITIADATRTGYDFLGWTSDELMIFTPEFNPVITSGTTGNITFEAVWDAIEYEIGYVLDGGTNDANNPDSYTVEDLPLTIANAAKPGYIFQGWTSDELGIYIETLNPIIAQGTTGNITFTAVWSDAIEYDITYILNGGTNDTSNPPTYTVEDLPLMIADATWTGYQFLGWTSDELGINSATLNPSITEGTTGNITFTAHWSNVIIYDIIYELGGGANDASNPPSYTINDLPITIADATRIGYDFLGWTSDELNITAAMSNPVIQTGMTGDIILNAVWSNAIKYEIGYDLDGGINDAGNPDSYTVEDLPMTIADAAKPGYNFLGWTSDELGINIEALKPEIPADTTGNIMFTAHWSDAIVYNITYELNGGANAPGNPSTYTVEDNLITLDDPMRAGYTFAGWTPSDNIPAGSTGDKLFIAAWTADNTLSYTVHYYRDGTTISVWDTKIVTDQEMDADIVEYAVDVPGYIALTTTEIIKLGLTDNVIIFYYAARDDIKVTFDANGGSNPNPENKLVTFDSAYGELATTSRSGYTFLGWYLEGGVDPITAEMLVEIAEDHTLFARWRADSNPPGPGPGPGNSGNTPLPPAVVEPTPTPTPADIFDDGPPAGPIFISDHVAYIIGYEDGTVRPERNVTRAEVATVFYRLLTEEMRKANWSIENEFPDVASDGWYNAAVSVNTMMGVIMGYPDGTFRPDNSITRGELAAIAARFARAMSMRGDNEVNFTDISGHWAEEDIWHAASIGWVRGYPDGTFRPDQPITRAEFITLVNNVLERIPETEEDMLTGEMTVWSDNADTSAWYYIAIQEATNSHLYSFKEGQTVPGMQFEYETWTAMQQNLDWIQLEKDWIAEYSTP